MTRTRLTPRAWGVLTGSIALLVGGQLLGYPILRVLAGAGIAAVVVSFLTLLRRPRLTVHRVLYPDRVECGRPALARLVVRNESGRRQPSFVAADVAGSHDAQVVVESLAAEGVATYHYELPTSRRGRLTVGPLTSIRTDALGLASCRVTIGGTTALLVRPRRHAARPANGSWQRHHFEGPVSAGPLRGSIDLRQLREYTLGDEVRHVHWKASARTGRLMVREYADPDQPRLRLVLDTHASALDADEFEAAVAVAASVLVASARAGHRLRLTTTGGVDHDVESIGDLLDELAEIEQAPAPDHDVLDSLLLPLGRDGGALVVLTGGARAGELMRRPDLRSSYRPVVCFDLAPGDGADRADSGVHFIAEAGAEAAVDAWNVAQAWNDGPAGGMG
ncbi:DUF58 domain-containing protein [Flindersiella endophytica]